LTHEVTFIPGDGSGPEVAEATRRALEATGVGLRWDVQQAGLGEYERTGDPFPRATLESIRRTRVALKGPTTTPVGSGFRSVNVELRRNLDLYTCLRPCKAYDGVRTRFPGLDLVIVRENTEDLYVGIEYEEGSEAAARTIELIEDLGGVVRADSAISIKPISAFASDRIVESAFDYAARNGRRKVTAVHKANIMKFTDGLFLAVAREVAARHPEIEFNELIVDNLANQLMQWPGDFDVLVLPNLYGDIISDLAAGMIGGLGFAGGANIGTDVAVFEATHGSAPQFAGRNMLNPTALMLSGVYMLRYLGERDAGDRLEHAIAAVISRGERVTFDLKEDRNDPTAVGTSEFADAVIEELNA
jgi:isocitrate dehydrogenase (NAD+)